MHWFEPAGSKDFRLPSLPTRHEGISGHYQGEALIQTQPPPPKRVFFF